MTMLFDVLLAAALIVAFIVFRVLADRQTLKNRTGIAPRASDCEHAGCMRPCDKTTEKFTSGRNNA